MKLVNYLCFLRDKHILLFKYHLFLRFIPYCKDRYEVYRYRLLEFLDPSPPKKKGGERDTDWYNRIDLKYSLRYARAMYAQLAYLDGIYSRNVTPELLESYPKKMGKNIHELTRAISTNAYLTKQRYQELLDKANI